MQGVDLSDGTAAAVSVRLCFAWTLVSMGLLGCGAAKYEQRLIETTKYFAYVKKMDDNLRQPWSAGSVNAYRVPKQFNPLPSPAPDAADDAEAPDEPDSRQPDYMDIELPGLLGGWRATVDTKDGTESVSSYLYVLSNYDLFTLADSDERLSAVNFSHDLVSQVATALGAPRPAENTWNELRVPLGEKYVETQTFTEVRMHATKPVIGVPTKASLYMIQANDIQVVILLVVPQDADDKLFGQMNMSLETLEVSPETPQGVTLEAEGAEGGTPPRAGRNF